MTPYAIQGSLLNLDEILGQDVPQANTYIKSLFVDAIKMVPKEEGGESFYEAQGQVNLTKLMRFTTPVNCVPKRTLCEPFLQSNLLHLQDHHQGIQSLNLQGIYRRIGCEIRTILH